jgi:hypothetical protein
MYLNTSALQRRIQKLDLEIDTPLVEKKITQERERELDSEELQRARMKGKRKKN